MKFELKRSVKSLVAVSLLASHVAMATTTASPSPSPSPSFSGSPSPVSVNPQILRESMVHGNYNVLDGLNSVYQAKLTVAKARANLLPGANIGGIVDLTAGPSFALSTVSILLPFLLPSNWFEEKASQYELIANEDAYYLVELNTYASIYSMYETLVSDVALRGVLENQYVELNNIAQVLQQENSLLGNVSTTDMYQATGAAQTAHGEVAQMDELIVQEEAALQSAMGLLPGANIVFDTSVHVPSSAIETINSQDALGQAIKIAPEADQISQLISASKDQKWADVFAFLNSTALGTKPYSSTGGSTPGSSAGSNSGLGDIAVSGEVNFGFATFPTVGLDAAKAEQLQLELRDLQLTEGQTLQSSIGSIGQIEIQLTDANNSVTTLNQVYSMYLEKYNLGLTDLLHVLNAQTAVTTAATNAVRAQADLDNQRINLHRIMMTDQFQPIPRCKSNTASRKHDGDGGPFGWLKDIFHPSSAQKAVAAMCM